VFILENILDFTLEEFKLSLVDKGEKAFRAKQVWDFINKNVWEFDAMGNIPRSTKELLKDNYYLSMPEIIIAQHSQKEDTHKFLLEYKDGNCIESVLMKYDYGTSICISTQIGCRMGCSFCASTVGGMVRNLSPGEILGEIYAVQKLMEDKVSNIVLMGSGEPLDNYDNVLKFLKLVNSKDGLNIGQRHITLSTCGIVPGIMKLADEKLQITLAISLHAPNDELRIKMMPIAKSYSIEEIIRACKYYISETNRRITFEYALVKGVNDSTEHAEELSKLLKGLLCHVNLIPVNEVKEREYEKPNEHKIKSFSYILTSHNIENTIRREMGSDIDAACGQLRKKYSKNNI